MRLDTSTQEFRRLLIVSAAAVGALVLGVLVTGAPTQQSSSAAAPQSQTAPQAPSVANTPTETAVSTATPAAAATPAGALMTHVVAALQGCAKTTNSQPINCPQRSSRGPQIGVSWELHGDPTKGARTVPTNGNQPPSVVGHYVMVAKWFDQGHTQPTYEVAAGLYQAPLSGVDDIGPFVQNVTVNPQELPTLDSDTRVTRDSALGLVRQALEACHGATARDWPTLCPGQALSFASYNQPTDQINLTSNMTGDLSANANLSSDSSTGLSVLTGSYDLKATWGGAHSGSNRLAGNYKAQLVWDQDHPSLLGIEYQ